MSISNVKETNNSKNILIISNDTRFRVEAEKNLKDNGYKVFEASSQTEAFALLEKINVSIIFLDIERTQPIEMDIVSYIRTRYDAEIVILTSLKEIEEATYALRNGAAFYLVKPVKTIDLLIILEKLYDRISQKKGKSRT